MTRLTLTGAGSQGSAPFTPASLPNLQQWIRADQGVTLNSGNVSQINDLSGNSKNFVQGVAGQQPLFVASDINSKPGMRFDGVDDRMGSTVSLNGAQTHCIVFKLTSTPPASGIYMIASQQNASATLGGLLLAINFAGYQPYSFMLGSITSGNSVGIADALNTSAHSLIVTFDGVDPTAPSSYTVRLDGVEKTVLTSGLFNIPSYGAEESLGQTSNGLFLAPIDVVEEIIYSAALNTSQKNQLTPYFNGLYGV